VEEPAEDIAAAHLRGVHSVLHRTDYETRPRRRRHRASGLGLGHQQARNVTYSFDEPPAPVRFLIRDRGAKFSRSFDEVLRIYAERNNAERPHRGLDLATPTGSGARPTTGSPQLRRRDSLGGLIHGYKRAA
jgi:hypothetical protein